MLDWPQIGQADVVRGSSLQSSSAGWAHHANRAPGRAADEGPAALGAAECLALCPNPSQPRVAWPPASSVWKAGIGSELHMGKLLQKTQQCFWTMSSSHRLWRLHGAGLVGSWALREG